MDIQKEFVDPLLYKFLDWMASKKYFEEGADISDDAVNPKLLAVACDITAMISSVIKSTLAYPYIYTIHMGVENLLNTWLHSVLF